MNLFCPACASMAPVDGWSRSAAPAPVLRAVLLGASNLRMGFPWVLSRLRAGAGGPVEVIAALGHGRSYGTWSRLLWVRQLPGIAGCGLWTDLDRRASLPTLALITDVGNDLLYGAPVPEIAGWVEACLERLRERQVEAILTLLPPGLRHGSGLTVDL